MKFGFYAPSLSFHLIPFFEEFKRDWGDECVYYYQDRMHSADKARYGWNDALTENSWWVAERGKSSLEKIDILMLSVRDVELMRKRVDGGLVTIYGSERWLKPIYLSWLGGFKISGIVRLILPSFYHLSRTIVQLMGEDNFYYFPYGVHAASDMARLCGLFHGDLRCLFRSPALKIERKPCGVIECLNSACYGVGHMRLWGYFVAASNSPKSVVEGRKVCKLLYVGRLLWLKGVDTIIKAVRSLPAVSLDVVGDGPDEDRLRKLVRDANVRFLGMRKVSEVRSVMRDYDVLVFASNEVEGWGAVVSEAIAEGVPVVGTFEAGSSGTILPQENLFHFNDDKGLRCVLSGKIKWQTDFDWSVKAAVDNIVRFLRELYKNA